MKKVFKIITALLILMVFLFGMLIITLVTMMDRAAKHGLEENNIAADVSKITEPLTITYMGDSLTAGVKSNGKMDSDEGYRGNIREELEEAGLYEADYNYAVGGYKIDDLVYQIESNTSLNEVNQIIRSKDGEYTADLASQYPVDLEEDMQIRDAIASSDVLILTAGANDILSAITMDENGNLQIDKDILMEAIYHVHDTKVKLFKEIKVINPEIQIYDVGMYMAYSHIDEDLMRKLYPLLAYGESKMFIEDESKDVYKVIIRDNMQANLTGFIDNPNNIHPNSSGYSVMSNEILKKISKTID